MRVLVIGARGQLGTEICAEYAGADLHAVDVDTIDIRNADDCRRLIVQDLRPELVINTAAAHNVQRCEQEPDAAFAVNAMGSRNLAVACRRCGARLVHVSTDYVFGNGGARPYVETDLPAPLSVYAASKLAGEHLIAAECDDYVIVRAAALYGPAPCVAKDGMNFVKLMLHLAKTRPEVKVVTDETTTPTYTKALAAQIKVVAGKGEPGLYHATCDGACSWYEFAQAIFEETSTSVDLVAATSEDFPSPVKRPDFSVLDNKHLRDQGLDIMPHWRDALRAYLEKYEVRSTKCEVGSGKSRTQDLRSGRQPATSNQQPTTNNQQQPATGQRFNDNGHHRRISYATHVDLLLGDHDGPRARFSGRGRKD